MYLRQAEPADLELIVRWRRDAADWLAEKGSDQWSDAGLDPQAFRDRVGQSIDAGETWMACTDDGTPVGTIALDQWADDGLWSEDTLRRSLVIHRMILDRSAAGQGVGQAMLEHAEELAAQRGLDWLILDAWTTNTGLHAYYQRHGFEHVRTVREMPSGALFQRRVRGGGGVLPTTIQRPVIGVERPTQGNPSEPDHWHVVDTVTVAAPRTHGGSTTSLVVPSDDHDRRLWFEAEAWRIAPPGHGGRTTTFERDLDLSTYTVTADPADELSALSPDVEYVIRHQATPGGCEVVVTAVDD